LPGVCIAITEGANEHRLDEYIEIGPIPIGMKNILLTIVALAGNASDRAGRREGTE